MVNMVGNKSEHPNALTKKEEQACVRLIREGTPDEHDEAWHKIILEFEDIIGSYVYGKKKINQQ